MAIVDTGVVEEVFSLAKGVGQDTLQLIRQELALFREELRIEVEKSRAAGTWLWIGLAQVVVGAILLCFGAVHLLHDYLAPVGYDPAKLPLGVCFAIVALLILLSGSLCLTVAKKYMARIDFFPSRTLASIEEDVEWLTRPKH